jgi:2-polyprenyl-3-methyl-5-hydroxy-6-metoxy-1,4-benzoquinol methylase
MLLGKRSHKLELLDRGPFSTKEYEVCLHEIELINRLTWAYRPTLNAVSKAAQRTKERPLKILDIGFGNGDTLRQIAWWAKKNNVAVELSGVELNPLATQLAQAQTPVDLEISFETQNIFTIKDFEPRHLIVNSLMTHHLTDSELKDLLKWMTQNCKVAWFINDLQRHWFSYISIKILTQVLGFSRLVRNDAPLSVQRSFTRHEWLEHLENAGLDLQKATVKWWWAFRYGVLYRV